MNEKQQSEVTAVAETDVDDGAEELIDAIVDSVEELEGVARSLGDVADYDFSEDAKRLRRAKLVLRRTLRHIYRMEKLVSLN